MLTQVPWDPSGLSCSVSNACPIAEAAWLGCYIPTTQQSVLELETTKD